MNNTVTLLIARILLAVIFIVAGLNKLGGIEGTAGYIGSVGLPFPTLLAWGTAVFEIIAGLAILAGFKTQWAAYALAAFCIASGIIFHNGFADPAQMTAMMKNFALAGGFLALSVAGAGALSVDARRN
jgi:putative oxidoreductase